MFSSSTLLSAACALSGAASVAAAGTNHTWGVQHFKSRPDLQPPVLEINKTDAAAPGYLVFTYTGNYATNSSGMIMTDDGELVYEIPKMGAYTNIKPDTYKGQTVLTYFNGITYSEPYGIGYGQVEVRDSHYETIVNVTIQTDINVFDWIDNSPGTGWLSYIDMHESEFTEDGTVLVLAENVTEADMTSVGGPKNGWVLDALVYEMDVATNETLFQWSALEHEDELEFSWANEYYPLENQGVLLGNNGSAPWGPFHLNSIEKFSDGSYLISSRFFCSLWKVRPDGSVEWRLDGQRGQDFTLENDLQFAYQHDARILKELPGSRYIISIFDNAWSSVEGNSHVGRTNTRGIYMLVDEKAMTATMLQDFEDPEDPIQAVSQGSFQTLPNGNSFMGYGATPTLKEFDPQGNVVFSAHFGHPSDQQMYRGYRFENWHATPAKAPDVYACRASGGRSTEVYMSWNGATEIESWSVLAGGRSNETLSAVVEGVEKTGFETMTEFRGQPKYIAAVAQGSEFGVRQSAVYEVVERC